MSKGPRVNNIIRNFTSRDSLGIEGVASSIQGEICPIVNTVTPRPFYWAFLTWCFYDFYKNCRLEEREEKKVYNYAKRQNYFFALSNILNEIDVIGGFTGSETIRNRINIENDKFSYDESYLKTTLSNMGYYPSGLLTMGFIVSTDQESEKRDKYPKLTPSGRKLAESFDAIISKTTYYKNRLNGLTFSRKELVELGKVININLNGFDETKAILNEHLFNRKSNKKLIECKNYIKFIYTNYKVKQLNAKTCREILFDYFSERGNIKRKYPNELKEIINNWEIVVGRQYFTAGLEMIWKFMLEQLNTPKTYSKWFIDCLNESKFSINLDDKLENILDYCNYNFQDRENMIQIASSKNDNHINNIENGLKIILSIYNRFINRTDLSLDSKNYFNYGIENNSISLNQFFETIERYKKSSIKSFLQFVMYHYLLEQHMSTAFEKMLQKRDGYYVEKINDSYVRKEYFDIYFQGIRLIQLMTVMKDLNIIGDE